MLISAVAWKIYLELSDGGRNTIMLPGNRQLRPIEASTGLSLCTFLGFFITGGSSTVFWLIATCLLVIVGHASMREAAATQAELALEELNRQDNIPPDWV
ncbi:hypothetical protein DIPPA_01306 [Diplonema papillatum]|nr:hypothetical protein DIPPA_01306 [Diplonema papillatum]